MIKKFELTITETDEGITITGDNNGFNAIELIGILEAKKQDIVEQLNHPEKFKHVRSVTVDGERYTKEEVSENDQT